MRQPFHNICCCQPALQFTLKLACNFHYIHKPNFMIHRVAKVEMQNTQVNFNASKEIVYWAKKYNTSQEEIQQIFQETGGSISKTIQRLQERQAA